MNQSETNQSRLKRYVHWKASTKLKTDKAARNDISIYTLSDLGELKQSDWFAILDYIHLLASG